LSYPIFETATGRKAGSVEVGEIAKERALAFGPDGRHLAARRDKIARVFEVATGKEIFQTEFDRYVIAVEFSPDGRYLAAHDDTTVRIFDGVPSGKLKHRD
jgi:WD40 repeat protein